MLFFSGRQRGWGQLGWDYISLPKSTCGAAWPGPGNVRVSSSKAKDWSRNQPQVHQTGLPGREHQGSGSIDSTWLRWLPFKDGAGESDSVEVTLLPGKCWCQQFDREDSEVGVGCGRKSSKPSSLCPMGQVLSCCSTPVFNLALTSVLLSVVKACFKNFTNTHLSNPHSNYRGKCYYYLPLRCIGAEQLVLSHTASDGGTPAVCLDSLALTTLWPHISV